MTNDMIDKLIGYIKVNKSRIVGGFIGFLISILILSIGFLKSLFIILCTWLGYFLGKKNYNKEDIKRIFNMLNSFIRRD